MNKDRRKRLSEALSKLSGAVEEAKGIVEEARDEEQDAYDNLPQPLQDGDSGSKMQDAINELEMAADALDTIEDDIADVISKIETAQE